MFGKSVDIGVWTKTNEAVIREALITHLKRALEWDSSDETLNSDDRVLSEMELCGVIELLDLPSNFSIAHGLVTVLGNKYGREHMYAYNARNDEVIDPTAGQFFVSPQTRRGEAVAHVAKIAPHLSTLMGEVLVVHGKRRDIKQSLGLIYT